MKNKEVKEWIWSYTPIDPIRRMHPLDTANYVTPAHVKNKKEQIEKGEGAGKLWKVLAIVGIVAVVVFVFVRAAL